MSRVPLAVGQRVGCVHLYTTLSPTMIVTIKDPGVTSDTHSPRGIIRNQAQVSGAADPAPQGKPNHHPYPLSKLAVTTPIPPKALTDLGETGTFVALPIWL